MPAPSSTPCCPLTDTGTFSDRLLAWWDDHQVAGIQDEDIQIDVEKTVVYISIADKLLFKSGSATVSDRAKEVLGKVATVVNGRPEMEVQVEGYTDNVPINTECMKDNWDLSVAR